MVKLLYTDAQGTDGTDPALIVNVYWIAGREVRVPANIPPEQVKAKVAQKYGISLEAIERLEQVEDRLSGFDLDNLDTLPTEATATKMVNAIKLLAQAVIELRAIVQFQMQEEPQSFFVD